MREFTKAYDEDCINHYVGPDGVRKRPAVYIKTIDENGIFKIAMELIQNTVDEFVAGRCSSIKFEYDSNTGYMKCSDDGCGIPLSKLYLVVTEMHAGGKFDNKAYKTHAGSNGMGLTICNFLSTEFQILSKRDGKFRLYKFEKGVYNEKDSIPEDRSWDELNSNSRQPGTEVSLIPDSTVFETIKLNERQIRDAFRILSYLNPGFKLSLIWNGKTDVYYSEQGITELLTYELKTRKIKYSSEGFLEIKEDNGGDKDSFISAEIIFNIVEQKNNCILSFVNNMRTEKHGTHVSGFRSGITRAINNYMKEKDYVPKALSKLDTSASIIRDYITGIISIKHYDPYYDSQTKEALTSSDVEPFVSSIVYEKFSNWLRANQKEAKRICDLVILEAKMNFDAKKARENVIKKSNSLADNYDSNKFIPCTSKDPEECEMLIIEGDSAAGNVNSGRDDATQAILKLRGKIDNMIKSSSDVVTNPSILLLIRQMGCGFGENKNLNKLRYGKIIILTDADEDGAHIQSLLLGFFYRYYPELLEEGRIYIAQPPLKTISIKKGKDTYTLYILNEKEHDFYLKEFVKYKFDLCSDKTGKKLSPGLFDLYLRGLLEYGPLMENRSKQLLMDPNILEYGIIYNQDILNNDFNRFNDVGVDVRVYHSKEKEINVDFDFGINHYFMKMNKEWYSDIYEPLMDVLSNRIKMNSVHLRYKDDGRVFKGTHFQTYKFISSFFEDGATVSRFKGLAETTAEVLKRSCLDKNTRRLLKVTMNDAVEANKAIELFLGKNGDRKTFFKERMELNKK